MNTNQNETAATLNPRMKDIRNGKPEGFRTIRSLRTFLRCCRLKSAFLVASSSAVLFATLAIAVNSQAAEWVNISESVTSQVKPGYAGPTAGIAVDPGSGDVYLVVSDQ